MCSTKMPFLIESELSRRKRESNALSVRHGRRDLGLDHAPPANGASADGFLERAEQDDVHHLAVIEALQDERRQKRPVLASFEGEGDDAGKKIDQHKEREENQGP